MKKMNKIDKINKKNQIGAIDNIQTNLMDQIDQSNNILYKLQINEKNYVNNIIEKLNYNYR